MGKRFILTEEEKNNIKSLYSKFIITEQTDNYFYDTQGNLVNYSGSNFVNASTIFPKQENNQYPSKIDFSEYIKIQIISIISVSETGYKYEAKNLTTNQIGDFYTQVKYKEGDIVYIKLI